MGWYIVEVRALDDRSEGYAIFDSVTGGIVRPLFGHPQSVFSEEAAERIAAHLERTCGDPRKGEHTIDGDTFTVLMDGAR